jgi:hypothetical protein
MYWTSILYYLSWPIFIVISFLIIYFIIKKADMLDKPSEE